MKKEVSLKEIKELENVINEYVNNLEDYYVIEGEKNRNNKIKRKESK